VDSQGRYKLLMVSRWPINRRTQSGTPFYMLQSLRRHVGEVDVFDGFSPRLRSGWAAAPGSLRVRGCIAMLRDLLWRMARRRYDWDRSRLLAKGYAPLIAGRVAAGEYDAVFIDKGYVEGAFLETLVPVVYSHDAVCADLQGYARPFQRSTARSWREILALERKAVERAAVCLYCSRWAAQGAIRHLGLEAGKIEVIRYGANLDTDPLDGMAEQVSRTPGQQCALLLIGVDWQRKGCTVALRTLSELRRMDVPATLTICGCRPPSGTELPEGAEVVGFLDKSRREDAERLHAMLCGSSFVFIPSRAECYGIAYIEGMAYGVPSVGCDVGGVSDIIHDGENGLLLPADAGPRDFAREIAACHLDRARYELLSRGARRSYREELNWDAWGRAFRARIMPRLDLEVMRGRTCGDVGPGTGS